MYGKVGGNISPVGYYKRTKLLKIKKLKIMQLYN